MYYRNLGFKSITVVQVTLSTLQHSLFKDTYIIANYGERDKTGFVTYIICASVPATTETNQ